MVVTPVVASPAAIAAWIGEAPRQRGRSEAWRLMAAVARQLEQLAREDLPEGDDDHDVRRQLAHGGEEAGVAHPLGLQERHAMLTILAAPARHRRVQHAAAAAGGA